jgi:outer membrane lipoprotein-sorting protein
MGTLRRLQPVAAALLLASLLSACASLASKRRVVLRRHKPVGPSSPALQSASAEDLNAIIARTYDGIHSFTASINLAPSAGSIDRGRIVDYPPLSGQIVFRKPNDIRVRASLPVVGTLAFEMAANDSTLRVNRENREFITGLISAPTHSRNKIENLRPQAFLSSILIHPWDRTTETVMLKDDTDEEGVLYRLEFNARSVNGGPVADREVWFDREDLSIVRQKVYDAAGTIVSDASYSSWKNFNGVPFPSRIDINRRMDEYGVTIEIPRMQMNAEIAPGRFDLPQPPGARLRVIE